MKVLIDDKVGCLSESFFCFGFCLGLARFLCQVHRHGSTARWIRCRIAQGLAGTACLQRRPLQSNDDGLQEKWSQAAIFGNNARVSMPRVLRLPCHVGHHNKAKKQKVHPSRRWMRYWMNGLNSGRHTTPFPGVQWVHQIHEAGKDLTRTVLHKAIDDNAAEKKANALDKLSLTMPLLWPRLRLIWMLLPLSRRLRMPNSLKKKLPLMPSTPPQSQAPAQRPARRLHLPQAQRLPPQQHPPQHQHPHPHPQLRRLPQPSTSPKQFNGLTRCRTGIGTLVTVVRPSGKTCPGQMHLSAAVVWFLISRPTRVIKANWGK
jgi:hypothetical protein